MHHHLIFLDLLSLFVSDFDVNRANGSVDENDRCRVHFRLRRHVYRASIGRFSPSHTEMMVFGKTTALFIVLACAGLVSAEPQKKITHKVRPSITAKSQDETSRH